MSYVFDSSSLIVLFRHYYPERFPTLWENFDELVSEEKIISVREVRNEVNTYAYEDGLSTWTKDNDSIFHHPTSDELIFITDIFKVRHFQSLIRNQERLKGKPVADPFVIAKAKESDRIVVTQEQFKDNAAKIPNICKHYDIPYLDLESFMEQESWTF